MSCKEDGHAAPSTAYVEDGLSVVYRELRGDVGQFCFLRLPKGHLFACPIGAAVLHVLLVEHHFIQVVSDVVVVRDILL